MAGRRLGTGKRAGVALGVIAAAIAVIAALAPPERVLGEGIKAVYLHVAASWAGLAGLYLAGLLGLVLLARPVRALEGWVRSIGWVSLALFALGFALSLLAAQINWGGVLWLEPRVTASLQVVALWAIVQVVLTTGVSVRVKAALWVCLTGYAVWVLRASPLVLHPERPIRTSTSVGIQASFIVLFALMLVAGGIAVGMVHRSRDADGAGRAASRSAAP